MAENRFQWIADQLNAQARAIAEQKGVSLDAAAQEIITGTPAAPPKAPPGGCWVKCPECTRVGPFFVEEGDTIVFCAQCAIGDDRRVRLVICEAPAEDDRG